MSALQQLPPGRIDWAGVEPAGPAWSDDPEADERRQMAVAQAALAADPDFYDPDVRYNPPLDPTLDVAPDPLAANEAIMPGLYGVQEQAAIEAARRDQAAANQVLMDEAEPEDDYTPLPAVQGAPEPEVRRAIPVNAPAPTVAGPAEAKVAYTLGTLPAGGIDFWEQGRWREPTMGEAAGETLDAVTRAFNRGWLMDDLAGAMEAEKPDATRVQAIQREMQKSAPSPEFKLAMDDRATPEQSWEAFKSAPVRVLGELMVESLTAYAKQMFEKAPARVAIGTGAGAAAGAPIAGIGAVPGGAMGATAGFAQASGASSYALEMSGGILEALEKAGVNLGSPEELQKAFNDPERMQLAREFAEKKAVPIALFDTGSALIAGRLVGAKPATVLSKIGKGAVETSVQAVLGMGGEASGQLAQSGEIQSGRQILAEGVGELGPGAIEVGVGAASMAVQRGRLPTGGRVAFDEATPTGTAAAAPTGVQAPWQAAREQAVPTVTQVEVVGDDVFGEPTTAAVERPVATGDERFAPPAEAAAPAPAAAGTTASVPMMITRQMEADLLARGISQQEINAMTPQQANEILAAAGQRTAEPAVPTGETTDAGDGAATAEPEPAVVSDLTRLPTVELPVQELQLSRDVPNFKEGADTETGVVEGERLEGEFQRLGMAPIIVWERNDGRREIISGRHRWDLAKRTKQETIPSQVLREADGFTTQDALILDAELNIRDGQGSIKDYANYFRNTQIDRGAATQRGLLSRAKGRAGFEIGRSGSNDLYAAFANKAVSADKAAAIAAAAPNNDTLQRAALGRAGNMTAEQLGGFVRALSARVTAAPETQTDLFGADDSALVQAEQLSKAANAKARQLQEQITAVRAAVRRPEAARKMGVDVRDPEGVRRKITELEAQVQRYQEFYANPDVMAELQATMRVGEDPGEITLAGPDAQSYFDFADVPKSKQQAGQQAVDAAASASDVPYVAPTVSARPRVDRSGELASARERQAAAYRALLGGDAQAVADAIENGVPLSRLMLGYISREPASFNIRGAIIKSARDLAMYNLAHRTPFFESLKIAVLDDRQQVIASQVVSTGTVNESLAHPRDILAVVEAAKRANPKSKIGGFMLMHNHPSGEPTPSEADRQMTIRLQNAAEIIGVDFIDHVITNGERYFSFREAGVVGVGGGKFARAGSKPKLSVLPKPEGTIEPGARAVWEAVPSSEAMRLGQPTALKTIQTLLQTADPNMLHVLNVDTRYNLISADRYSPDASPGDMVGASITQGTYAVLLSLPQNMDSAAARDLVRKMRQAMSERFYVHVLDAMGPDGKSYKEQGLLEEPDAPYGSQPGQLRVAEEAPRTKPRQFEAKARQNEALAPETRARLGSEYIPISLNAQAEAAKEWINTNGLDAAKLRIAQLSGNDTVPTPVDFAIGIEAAGRLSATGDHAGAAGIVSTMSQRATSLGQTISVLAMMARLTPEGIVLYGQNIVSRYINTLPQEAQDRIKALQAEVDRLRTALAEMKFKEGSEVIRSGKLGDEKIQDRIKRRVKARVQADLGPAAAGPEVTAETKARTQGLNRQVRDVLLSDAKQSEMVKQITQILTSEGNMPAAEAEAVGKSIVAAFTKIVTETRRNYVQGAKRGAGGRRGGFDALLKLLGSKPDMTDAEFVSHVSQLMGLPGMTPELARELRALAQRYEKATDPDIKLVLGATLFERAHEVLPVDFWVKVRGFAYLSMLFAPKTWIRNVIGNQIQWIANVGRDAVVSGVMDPLMSLFTGQRTTAGLKLGARLKGLLAPIEDVRKGYLWSKQQNPEFNFRQNFMAGVNHLRMLAKLTTQNKFEIADVRNVGARIFSSKLMRAWEGTLSIALGAGDRAFWMSQFRASLAQMQAAAEKNGEWTGQPTPEMIEAAMAEAAYAIYQNPNIISANANKIRGALNRLSTFGKTDQYGLGTGLMAFTQVPGSITLRGLIEWSPLGMIPALYRGMRGILYATAGGRIGAKFDQAAFNKEFTQALLGTGTLYAAGYYLYALGIVTASREDDDDLEAMRRASGKGAYRINLTALRRALLSGNWFTRQEGEQGDVIVPYDWAQPLAITFAAGAELAAQVERSGREQLKKGLAEKAGMAAMSLAAGAKSLEELPLLSGLSSFIKTWGYAGPLEALTATVAGMPSQFVPQLVRQFGQINDNLVRETRGGDSVIQREFMKVLASVPGYSTKFPVRFDITGQAIQRYQYGGNSILNVFFSPAMASEVKRNPVLQEVSRLVDTTGETSMVPRQVKRSTKINGVDVDLTNEQLAAYSYYLGNFTMSHFAWRMAAPVYARLPDEMKVKMLAQDITDIDAAVKSAVLGADPRRLTRNQMFLRQALVNSPLGQSVPPR